MSLQDAYQRLRPSTDIERCECASAESLLLIDLLSDNPIHCDYCRKEIDPERLQLTAEETHYIAHWFGAASALYRLWLDSGEYEQYAKQRLLDPQGQINIAGREIARKLSEKWPTRFWFFHDTDDGEPTQCPICQNPLDEDVKWRKWEEAERRRQVGIQCRKSLEAQSDAWGKTQNIRSFLRSCEDLLLNRSGSIAVDSAEAKWLAWAHRNVDRLDPLKNGDFEKMISMFAGII